MGVVTSKSSTQHVVLVPNDSPEQRSVKAIGSDCGCIVHRTESAVVGPGESWELKFRYDAPDSYGAVSQRIVVTFNEAGVLPALVHIEGIVRNWAEASPQELSFGDALPGSVVEKELIVVTARED